MVIAKRILYTVELTNNLVASKAFNNPFYDWTLKGRNVMTIVAGEIVWQ